MMHGSVVGLQARLDVTFRLPGQPDFALEFVVDTGFEGALTLPASVVAALGLPFLIDIDTNLASDDTYRAKVHIATILWNGQEREVAVIAMGRRPLLGTTLLDGWHLGIDFLPGGAVIVDDVV